MEGQPLTEMLASSGQGQPDQTRRLQISMVSDRFEVVVPTTASGRDLRAILRQERALDGIILLVLENGQQFGDDDLVSSLPDAATVCCFKMSVNGLKEAGSTLGQMRHLGCTAADAKIAGYSIQEATDAGYTLEELKGIIKEVPAGTLCGTWDYRDKSYTIIPGGPNYLYQEHLHGVYREHLQGVVLQGELTPEGEWFVAELCAEDATAGFIRLRSVCNGIESQFKTDLDRDFVKVVVARQCAGYIAAAVREAGSTWAEIRAAGHSLMQIRDAGATAKDAKNLGCSLSEMRLAGYRAEDVKAVGCRANEAKAAGYDIDALRSGYKACELAEAGFPPDQLVAGGLAKADWGDDVWKWRCCGSYEECTCSGNAADAT